MTAIYSVICALVFNVLDILSGLIAAIKNKNLESGKLRDGLFKKVGFIFCYFMAWLLDAHGTEIGFSIGVSVLPIIILYVCTTEIVSITENISKINPDIVPEKLLEMLHIGNDKK